MAPSDHSHSPHPHPQPKAKKADIIRTQVIRHGGLVLLVIALLVAGRFVLPRLPFLSGWEGKFTASAVSLGKEVVPNHAVAFAEKLEIMSKFGVQESITEALDLKGPLPVGAWNCTIGKDQGVCLRYHWEAEPLTLIISVSPKKASKLKGPFTKAGYSGYFVIQPPYAVALVGPFTVDELLSVWPWAQNIRATQLK
ncbi:MAG: hypothetical protein IT289_01090 [Oligoflexia bacterium]|nr:hypothetical protein [Oligoflexia bacterium]